MKGKIIQPTKIAVESIRIAVKAVRFTKSLKNLSGFNFAAIKTMFSFLEIEKNPDGFYRHFTEARCKFLYQCLYSLSMQTEDTLYASHAAHNQFL